MWLYVSPPRNFNPRSREGSDITHSPLSVRFPRFQSTLPRRERLAQFQDVQRSYRDFNPRSREGSDQMRYCLRQKRENFNPRSREGSDWLIHSELVVAHISIHAPAKGATSCLTDSLNSFFNFNPRSREGSD